VIESAGGGGTVDSRRCACGQLSGHRGALTDGASSGFRRATRQRNGRSSSSPGAGGLGAQGGDAGPSGRLRRLPQQSTGGSITFPDTLPLPWRAPDARRARSDALLLLRHRVPPNRVGQMAVERGERSEETERREKMLTSRSHWHVASTSAKSLTKTTRWQKMNGFKSRVAKHFWFCGSITKIKLEQ